MLSSDGRRKTDHQINAVNSLASLIKGLAKFHTMTEILICNIFFSKMAHLERSDSVLV
jgi:hypothetical protein